MAHDVFISHSSKDKPIADAICANLEGSGIRCWIAPRDIIPGEDWPTAITNAIAQSRIMVLVFSANSNSSEDVGREIMLAANNKAVIIPFKIENIEPEPGKQYYLANTHWLDAINPPTQEQIEALVDCVKALVPAIQISRVENPLTTPMQSDHPAPHNEPPQQPMVQAAPRKKAGWTRYLWIPGGLIALVFIGLILFMAFGSRILPLTVKALTPPKTAIATIQKPIAAPQTKLPATTTQPSSSVDIANGFNNQAFAGGFDPSLWRQALGGNPTTIEQENGAMKFSKLNATGMAYTNLGSVQTWSLENFGSMEADLEVDSLHAGSNANLALTLSSGSYYGGCGLSIGDPQPFIWCGQGSTNGTIDFMSDSYYVDYGKWYTVRIEVDPRTAKFTGSIDGTPFYSWQPTNSNAMFAKKYVIAVGIWSDDGSSITGYVKNLRIIK